MKAVTKYSSDVDKSNDSKSQLSSAEQTLERISKILEEVQTASLRSCPDDIFYSPIGERRRTSEVFSCMLHANFALDFITVLKNRKTLMQFSCFLDSPPETAARGYNSDSELHNVSLWNKIYILLKLEYLWKEFKIPAEKISQIFCCCCSQDAFSYHQNSF